MPQEKIEIDPVRKAMLQQFLEDHSSWLKIWNTHNPNQPPPVAWDDAKGEWIWLTRKVRRKQARKLNSSRTMRTKSSSSHQGSSNHGPSQDNEIPKLPKGVDDERVS
jgi:hypothetical protein